MKEKPKGRKSQNRNQQRQTATSQLTEKDAWLVQLNAYAIGSVAALQDFPSKVIGSPEEMEANARFALVARLSALTLSQEYDLFTLAAVFVPAFCKAYCYRIDDYQTDEKAYKRDRMHLGEHGGYNLMNWYIEVNGKRAM